mgnify:CR=1 FL=1
MFDPSNLKVVGNFLAGFLPPETGAEFLGYLGKATLETLAIATAGMALAFALAVPLAYLASGAGREKTTLNPLTRSLLTLLRGIPELVWALVFVRVFGLGPAAGVLALGLTDAFVPALPVGLMKTRSGSGARGLMVDVMTTYGVDSFQGKLAAIIQGSTETTFYVLAVYFGSVNITKTRYAVAGGLIADAVGLVGAILIGYAFYH